jgi:hypothetical protein
MGFWKNENIRVKWAGIKVRSLMVESLFDLRNCSGYIRSITRERIGNQKCNKFINKMRALRYKIGESGLEASLHNGKIRITNRKILGQKSVKDREFYTNGINKEKGMGYLRHRVLDVIGSIAE